MTLLQNINEERETADHELAKVKRDRDLAMKKKEELAGILTEAAGALKSSLMVRIDYHVTIVSKNNLVNISFVVDKMVIITVYTNFCLLKSAFNQSWQL